MCGCKCTFTVPGVLCGPAASVPVCVPYLCNVHTTSLMGTPRLRGDHRGASLTGAPKGTEKDPGAWGDGAWATPCSPH